jgi:hypothetical protein
MSALANDGRPCMLELEFLNFFSVSADGPYAMVAAIILVGMLLLFRMSHARR